MKKKRLKIGALEPLKWEKSTTAYSANCVYMIRRLASPWKRASSRCLWVEHVYLICEANFFILGVPVHQFECFFFNWLKISHRFHFFVLEHQQMKPDGRTVRTTVHTVRAYEYDEARWQEKARTTRNSPVLKSKIIVF